MKHCYTLLLFALLTALLTMPVAAFSASDIVSDTAVLMDADTGQVLFDKGMHRRMFPASTTKVMTALLVCENSQPDDIVTVSESALNIEEWNSTNIALQPGERVTVDELLYALILPSANDAANVLAEHVAGSQKEFAEMMTERARQLGALDTRFTNAHGLHESAHYTTAYDMALITAFAMQNEMFRNYFGTALHTMPPTNLQEQERYFTNIQYMVVKETQYYNENVVGGKVGYTREAKHTMTTAAERNGRSLICVVMSSTNRWEKFQDTQALLDYGFDEFRPITLPASAFRSDVVSMGDEEVTFYSESDFTALLRRDLNEQQVHINYQLPDTLDRETTLPKTVEVLIDSDERTLPSVLGSQPILNDLPAPAESLPENAVSVSANATPEKIAPLSVMHSWFAPVAVAVLFLAVAVFFLVSHYQLQKRRRRRLEQLRRMRSRSLRKSA